MRKISFVEWNKLVINLSRRINLEKYRNIGVYGVPRGGTLISLCLHLKCDIPLLESPIKSCLVVDDLIDSGKTKEKYKDYDFEVLITKNNNEWIEFWYENTINDKEDLIIRQLELLGENPNREGLKLTPLRVINMWNEIFKGYNKEKEPKITTFSNGVDGIVYDQLIIDEGFFYSFCEHHMLPFFGKYWFGYIPHKEGKILGLSKVARVIDFHSSKLQTQERIVSEVINTLWNKLSYENEFETPLGMGIVLRGKHLCKCMRGIKNNGFMTTIQLKGVLKILPEARAEFLNFVNGKNSN